MSEEQMELELSPTEQLIDALAVKNFNQAQNHFNDIIGQKVSDALDAEKIKVADTIFNGVEEEEDFDDEDFDYEDLEDEDLEDEDLEDEVFDDEDDK